MGIQHSTHSPAVLTVSETAVYFRISRASVWRLLRTGQLKKVRIGGRTLVRRVDADAFLESCVGAA
ncbi:MAG: helix-turn-helix domain-containing protein [Mesorhizobium sp.]|uniref:helix-turn-helix domain-containing protein n=1 Tax=unclassified Mesorhizobium TaxID=325217 RepID=UPI000F758213|nr:MULTISPECIES: helix-turn-helix domain-containing protein [unclassified Mesorhizobium]RVC68951.1 helix-turn-helix domain-containing protein [Mesorhizobium sp. M00.F.Ca.ET.038.03.1.1]RVC77710.1 helix-turn-helix domain-containing protein [Mesorhizobium sp. M2A.F.Ca.ET.046.02.1.1]AZO36313.1 DNA-binding protein [Mesorhizobium sp. M2A.F.Ca.ET.046.03.2.1]RWB39887.1 MAG: helix-turn-helix domain-containing protein [Mesorhizobium sp.]RWE14899.1 MAG: helix-turn-helix domain-containing protein [Mesorhi